MYLYWMTILFFEAGLPIYINGNPDLYPLYSETRHLLWIYGAYALSLKRGIILRACLLLAVASQCFTVIVFALDLISIDVPVQPQIEAALTAVALAWVALRSYSTPTDSVPLRDMTPDRVYLIVKSGSPKRVYDLVLSMFGYPATSVSLYCSGKVYQYRRAVTDTAGVAVYTATKYAPSKGDIYRCAIPTELRPEDVKLLLDKMVGTRYRLYRANCATTPAKVWDLLGITRTVFDAVPGVITARILLRLSRMRKARRD